MWQSYGLTTGQGRSIRDYVSCLLSQHTLTNTCPQSIYDGYVDWEHVFVSVHCSFLTRFI